jgi:isoquinoline 1-oxidoreductase beta subunit
MRRWRLPDPDKPVSTAAPQTTPGCLTPPASATKGGVAFDISGALWGEVTLKRGRVQQSNFHDVRALRMNEMPVIEVHLVKSGEAPGGIGEPGTAVTAPALANAVFAANGKRIRALPLKRERLRSA